jgi:hypothetical protein
VLLDRLGLGILPVGEVAFLVAAIAFMLATDRFRIARHPG